MKFSTLFRSLGALVVALLLLAGTLTQTACGPQDVRAGAGAAREAAQQIKDEAAQLRRSGDISEEDEKRVVAIADELMQSATNLGDRAAKYDKWTPEAKRELLSSALTEISALNSRLDTEGLSPIKSEKAKRRLQTLTRGIRIGKSALAIALAALPLPRAQEITPREQ